MTPQDLTGTPEGTGTQKLPDTPLGRLLEEKRQDVLACAARRGASRVTVFGSVARGEDNANSDIDLVVDLAPGTSLFGLMDMQEELETLLGVSVDLGTYDGLKEWVRPDIERDGILL